MQRRDALLDVQMHHHRGVLPVGPARGLGVPPGLDQPHERLTAARQRRPLICAALAIVALGTVVITIVALAIVVIGTVVITIVVIVLPLGDQRITMRLQRRVELRRVGVPEFDPVAAERLVGGLGDRRPRLGGGFGVGLGIGFGFGVGARFQLESGAQLADRGHRRQRRIMLIRSRAR